MPDKILLEGEKIWFWPLTNRARCDSIRVRGTYGPLFRIRFLTPLPNETSNPKQKQDASEKVEGSASRRGYFDTRVASSAALDSQDGLPARYGNSTG